MKKYLSFAILSLLFVGTGCFYTKVTTYPSVENNETIAFETYSASDVGISFEVPVGVKVHDGLNGFENVWKFEYDGNSYIVSYNEFRDQAIYAGWDGIVDFKIVTTNKPHGKIFTREGMAYTESFFPERKPAASISVSKHDGVALMGEISSDDDVVYQHLLKFMKLDAEFVF
ncbi:MAG: hypothetical protein AAB431_01185 [Patescibacteria group bacterium]